jgi:hypothetical protein
MFKKAPTRSGTTLRFLKCLGAVAVFAVGACDQEPTAPSRLGVRAPARTLVTTTQLIIDTGPGSTIPGHVIGGGIAQNLAAQFSVSESTDLAYVSVWAWIFVAGDVTLHIRADAAGQPGTDLYTKTYTVATTPPFEFDWYTFDEFNTTLAAGTYWITLEVPTGSGVGLSLPYGAASPMDKYMFQSTSFPSWSQSFGNTPSMAFRIAEVVALPPNELITDLQDFVSGSGIVAPLVKKINGELEQVDKELAKNHINHACKKMDKPEKTVSKESGRKIPTGIATDIMSDMNDIEDNIGC